MLEWLRGILRGIVTGIGVDELDGLIRQLTAVLVDAAGYAYPVPRWSRPIPAQQAL